MPAGRRSVRAHHGAAVRRRRSTRSGGRAGRRNNHQRSRSRRRAWRRTAGSARSNSAQREAGEPVASRIALTARRAASLAPSIVARSGVRPHVVGGQHQVGDPRRRVGPVAPRPGGVDQQRLEVGRLRRVGELDRRIEEPGEHPRLVEERLRSVVEVIDELAPDLGADLLAAATRRHLARAPSRRIPVGHVDGEDPANVPIAVAPDVDVAPELGLRDRRQRPLRVDVDRVTVDDRDVRCRGRTARRSSTG